MARTSVGKLSVLPSRWRSAWRLGPEAGASAEPLKNYDEFMTTRDDLHHLVDCIDADELDAAEVALRPYAEHLPPPLPASMGMAGMGHSGRSDLSEHADELLAETGFGR